ncbi:hypothetical protein GCM10023196_098090 [Actinoallomurus vinaceus]|uniref:Uncharacterized protein n=1 Tax=Actinoallomurus vinaceus TaxID=1080074 RepID=A0ABP8UTA8_9ACTN
MTVTAPEMSATSLPEVFQAPADPTPQTDHLFTGTKHHIVQTPPVRNDYKKTAGSSDGAKTYDTTAK